MNLSDETRSERIRRKAKDIRRALIDGGVVISPDSEKDLFDLPDDRQERWLDLADTYCHLFPGRNT